MARLAVFLDGTWNKPKNNTNVWRLHQALGGEHDGVPQLAYYDPGPGTAFGTRILGGAFGYGLSGNVVQAYRWLVQHWRPNDEIFLFGFSRGAYTARSLGGLIAHGGLLTPGAALTVEDLYARYRSRKKGRASLQDIEFRRERGQPITAEEQALLAQTRRARIRMLGVWDTVGALGVPLRIPGIGRRRFEFHNTNLSVYYDHAFHAVAIDEHRLTFAATLWTQYTPGGDEAARARAEIPQYTRAQCEQRWFVGAHGDVGGGGDENLMRRPREWIRDRAAALGLAFTSTEVTPPTDTAGAPSDSYSAFLGGVYRLVRGTRFFRPIGAGPTRVKAGDGWSTPINEVLDESVAEYARAHPGYRPVGVVEYWKMKR